MSSRHRILRETLGRRHEWDLIEIRRSPGVCRWSRVAARKGSKLMLRYVVEPGLLCQTRKDLRSIAVRLSK